MIIFYSLANSEMSETSMNEFCEIYNLKNLVKELTCFKNQLNPTCVDLMLTNRPKNLPKYPSY